MKILLCLTIFIFTIAVEAQKKTFEGSKLFKVVPKTADDVKTLEYMRDSGIGDFWIEYFKVNDDLRIMVTKEQQSTFLGRLQGANIEVATIIEDVQK